MRRGMDMDYCPFCSNRRDSPSPPVPLELRGQTKPVHAPTVEPIPVHLVGSERSLSDSAVKIQKAFRGFLVRKCVQKIGAIRKEVDEIEYKIAEKYTFDLILRDSNERLKVTETLMSLLFRLDSVRGVDAGVRNFRKSVIKKAIALQELVDLVVAGNQKPESVISKTVNQNETVKFGENAVNRTRKRGRTNSACNCPITKAEQNRALQNEEKEENEPQSACRNFSFWLLGFVFIHSGMSLFCW